MGTMHALRILVLNDNALEALPPSLASLGRLRELFLGGNALRALPPLAGLRSLTLLELDGNPLGDAALEAAVGAHAAAAVVCAYTMRERGCLACVYRGRRTAVAGATAPFRDARGSLPGQHMSCTAALPYA